MNGRMGGEEMKSTSHQPNCNLCQKRHKRRVAITYTYNISTERGLEDIEVTIW